MPIYIAQKKSKLYLGNQKVKKAYLGNVKVYSSGSIVTYRVDSGITYQEEVDEGETCLSPKTFVPSKAGWMFAGWREDADANAAVLSSKIMGDNPITLYAVFRSYVTLTLYNNNTSPSANNLAKYYNNGNVSNPTYKANQATRSGWTARGWSTSNAASAGIAYANGATITVSADMTLYGCYQAVYTLTYNGNGATGGSTDSQSGTAYYNSSGQASYPTVIVQKSGFNRSDYVFTHWSYNGTSYHPGQAITLTSNITLSAQWIANLVGSFAYTGTVRAFSVPYAGLYKLEVWGAAGGNSNGGSGGLGGYASGNVSLLAGQTIYVVVGEMGASHAIEPSGQAFNGGGKSGRGNSTMNSGGGGGATHIGAFNNTLAEHNSKSGLYIVAGGGGGAGSGDFDKPVDYNGGSGGGLNGGDAGLGYYGWLGSGATQIDTGRSEEIYWGYPGGFGYGGGVDQFYGGGGGGGLYGGRSGGQSNGGGGGSGYIGGVDAGAMQNGINSGHGRAAITLLSVL